MLNTRTGETEVWITRNGIVGEAKALKDGKWQLLPGERYVPGRPSGRFNANGKELNPDAEENMLNAQKVLTGCQYPEGCLEIYVSRCVHQVPTNRFEIRR